MLINKSGWGVGFTSVCVFLFGALSLVISSGYSYGPALLFLASIPLVVYPPAWPVIRREERLLIAVLALFMLVWIAEVLLTGQGSRELDKPSRFLAAISAFILVLKFPPKPSFVWSGIAVGALGAAGLALWERFFEDAMRASGDNHPIQFGNISLLLGLFCLAGLGWAICQRQKAAWVTLLTLSFVVGFFASLLSGSRGGWVGLPIVLLVLYLCYKPFLKSSHVVAVIVAGLVLAGTAYLVPQTGVQARVMEAVYDIQKYNAGDSDTSVGARLDMWKGASMLIAERPLTGWGAPEYRAQMEEFSRQGIVDPFVNQFGHAHNEYLDVLVKRGIVGLSVLLLLYFLPLVMFLKRAKDENLQLRSIAAGGAVLCAAYIDFGLTQTFLSHNSGVMVFVFYLVVFWSMLRSSSADLPPSTKH